MLTEYQFFFSSEFILKLQIFFMPLLHIKKNDFSNYTQIMIVEVEGSIENFYPQNNTSYC